MAAIETTLERLTQQFARELVEALVRASIEQVVALSGSQPRQRASSEGQTSPRLQSRLVPKATTALKRPQPSSSKRTRRSADDLQGLVERLVRVVVDGAEAHPEGVAVGDLAKVLRRDSQELTRPLYLALSQGLLKKKGEKRQTRYFPGKRVAC